MGTHTHARMHARMHARTHTHKHTHTHLTALCPGLPRWAGTRAICKSAPHSRQITTPAPHHSVFTGWMPFLPPNQQRQSTEGRSMIKYKFTDLTMTLRCSRYMESLWANESISDAENPNDCNIQAKNSLSQTAQYPTQTEPPDDCAIALAILQYRPTRILVNCPFK